MGYDNILTPALDDWIRKAAQPSFSTFKLVVFGLALILMLRFRPEGLFPLSAEREVDPSGPPGGEGTDHALADSPP
jgi:branched-chain amino acid transport system permease protein